MKTTHYIRQQLEERFGVDSGIIEFINQLSFGVRISCVFNNVEFDAVNHGEYVEIIEPDYYGSEYQDRLNEEYRLSGQEGGGHAQFCHYMMTGE